MTLTDYARLAHVPSHQPVRFGSQPDGSRRPLTPDEAAETISNLVPGDPPKTLGGAGCAIPVAGLAPGRIYGVIQRDPRGVLTFISRVSEDEVRQVWFNGQTESVPPNQREPLVHGTSLVVGGVRLNITDPVGVQALQEFVEDGLRLMAQKNFEGAKNHFLSETGVDVMRRLGGDADTTTGNHINRGFLPDNLADFLGQIKHFSYFAPGIRRIKLIDFSVDDPLMTSRQAEALKDQLTHEACMVYADHWLDALQTLTGRNLGTHHDRPVDRAFFMRHHRVPMTMRYLREEGRDRFPFLRPVSDD